MTKKKTKQTLVMISIVAIVALASFFGMILFAKLSAPETASPSHSDSSTSDTSQPQPDTEPQSQDAENIPETTDVTSESVLSPDQVRDIDIAPLNITVSYKRGTKPFEYEVLRTASGTKYVEFRSQLLIGTKCTNDQGAFASILVNPNPDEIATVAKQVTRDGDVYGLSLASDSCTGNTDLLQEYQSAFGDAFTLLQKM